MSQRCGGGGGLGVRGKYVCSGMNFVKWLNYSDNNLMDLEGRTASVMTVFVRVCVSVRDVIRSTQSRKKAGN